MLLITVDLKNQVCLQHHNELLRMDELVHEIKSTYSYKLKSGCNFVNF